MRPYCLIDGVFCLAEALQFYEVPFVDSQSYSISHCCSIQEFFPCIHIFEAFPYFLLYKFQCLWFKWSCLIHLDLTLVQGDRNGSIHILLHDNHQLCQHHLLKMLSFSTGWFLLPCQRSSDHRSVGSFLGFHSIPLVYLSVDITVPCSFLSQLLCSTDLGQAW